MWSWAHTSAQGDSFGYFLERAVFFYFGIFLSLLLLSWLAIFLVLRSLLEAYLLGGYLLTVRLPRLVTDGEEVGVSQPERRDVVAWVSGAEGSGKRVRLNRKTPAHLVLHGSLGVQSRSRIWKRLCIRIVASDDRTGAKRRRLHQHDWDHGPGHDRTGGG